MAGCAVKTTLHAFTLVALIMGGASAMSTPGSKDDKYDFTIEIQRADVTQAANYFFKHDTLTMRTSQTEDSRMMLNVDMTSLKDITTDISISIVLGKQDQHTNVWVNKYNYNELFCDMIENNKYFYNNMFKNTNFPKKCPIPAGEYYFKDITLDTSEFPKHMEEAKWRAEVNLYDRATRQTIASFTLYVDIEELLDDDY